jgi:hypothetical protein
MSTNLSLLQVAFLKASTSAVFAAMDHHRSLVATVGAKGADLAPTYLALCCAARTAQENAAKAGVTDDLWSHHITQALVARPR